MLDRDELSGSEDATDLMRAVQKTPGCGGRERTPRIGGVHDPGTGRLAADIHREGRRPERADDRPSGREECF